MLQRQQREGGPRESGGSAPSLSSAPGPSCQSRQQPVDPGTAVRLLWALAGPGQAHLPRVVGRSQVSELNVRLRTGVGVGDGAAERQ